METVPTKISEKKKWLPVLFYILIATTAVGFYSWNSTLFVPTIHDEQSYLFQAKTFLLGRVVNPPHPERQFFDQYHIINEGVYASKYFPGFAVTLAPFVLLGVPYLNPLFFYALQLLLIFLLGQELFGRKTAWLAMVLVSLSPQIIFQTCFLLGHIPCAVFLLFFYYMFLKSERALGAWRIALGALSWGLAFLIRPITAVGFALSVACYVLYRLFKKEYSDPGKRLLCWLIPLALTTMIYCGYNKAVTGSYLKAPFDYYAQIHAPFHRYGFDTWNKYAAEAKGPRVDKWFNEYYHNHTPLIGLKFMGVRLGVLIEFLFGSTWLAFALFALWLIRLRERDPRDWMIFWIFLSLQVIHIPHWYPGILTFGSNYLYEVTGLILIALSNALLVNLEKIRLVRWQKIILTGIIILCAAMSAALLTELSLYQMGTKRQKLFLLERLTQESSKPKVVFVRYPPEYNINLEVFVDNPPDLKGPLIFAHDRGRENFKLIPYFPGYSFYIFDFPGNALHKLRD